MQGFPKTIATRQDAVNLLAVPEYHDRIVVHLQALLDERYGWVVQGRLPDGEVGDASAGHKIETLRDMESGEVVERYQYVWGLLPGNGLERLGVTATECVAWGCEDRVIDPPVMAG